MKLILAVSLFCFLISCKESNKECQSISKVHFISYYQTPTNIEDPNAQEEISFRFFISYFNSLSDTKPIDSKSLWITIPRSDSVFTFKPDSSHRFVHIFSSKKGGVVKEPVDTAEISGVLVSGKVWEIKVVTKYFDFNKHILLSGPMVAQRETLHLSPTSLMLNEKCE